MEKMTKNEKMIWISIFSTFFVNNFNNELEDPYDYINNKHSVYNAIDWADSLISNLRENRKEILEEFGQDDSFVEEILNDD